MKEKSIHRGIKIAALSSAIALSACGSGPDNPKPSTKPQASATNPNIVRQGPNLIRVKGNGIESVINALDVLTNNGCVVTDVNGAPSEIHGHNINGSDTSEILLFVKVQDDKCYFK